MEIELYSEESGVFKEYIKSSKTGYNSKGLILYMTVSVWLRSECIEDYS